MKSYQIAIYVRLSKEDDKYKEESSSITMQRILLQKFVKEHFTAEKSATDFPADYNLLEFCDDGYTGTNFKRPGMQAMLAMAKESKIDCIIVKDFSRFARDYIELGSYLEQIFPFMGIRFIAINDNYDSKDYQGSIAGMDVNFKNLLYDLYSKDLSQKVRASLAARKEKGLYVSASSPFGYEKDQEDRHALLIAKEEAEIVRKIFSLTAEGHTSVEIARLFNETNVTTPIQFRIKKGETCRNPKGDKFLWSGSTICQILRNEIYIGNIVQKKTTKDHVGGKNHLNPHEEWLVSYNHHEPIIDKQIFDKVQEGRGNKKAPQYHQTHPLIGKLVCGCCRKNLGYRRGLNPYFCCRQRYSNNMRGCVEKVNAMFLEQYVLYEVQKRIQKSANHDRMESERIENFSQKQAERQNKEEKIRGEQELLLTFKVKNYEQYAHEKEVTKGMASETMYRKECERIAGREAELSRLLLELKNEEKAIAEGLGKGNHSSECRSFHELSELAGGIVQSFIERIVVYSEQHIEICWKER